MEIAPVKINPPESPGTNLPKWYKVDGDPSMPPVRTGNDIQLLIDGQATFKEMANVISTAVNTNHYIYLIGWSLIDDFRLVNDEENSTMISLLKAASENGVEIRVMLSEHLKYDENKPAIEHINALAHGVAIYDNRHLEFGSHHQKILVVKGLSGLIAFCGGIDIHSDRLMKTAKGPGGGEKGAPLHDVHCRIQGAAAYDLLKIFVERWQDYIENVGLNQEHISLLGASEGKPSATDKAYYIQVGRTYGNISTYRGIDSAPNNKQEGNPKGYSFAPNGEQTARRMILHAISQAQEFIYMEDQYLVSMEVSRALLDALPKLKHLTILIPHGSISDMPQIHYRRREFIAPLKAAGGSKVRVFYLNPPGDEHTYVHAKVYMIDDEFAILGSVNCNRRSLTHDSEVAIGVYDDYETHFAQAMRIKLWAEHLNLNKADVVDGIKSVSYWINPPPGARVAPYDENEAIELLHTNTAWDTIEDPDGG